MRVMVTGGAGFIGSHVVDKLRDQGHEAVIYDRRPSPWHDAQSVDTVIGSITDIAALELALADCDAVAHLAAVADVSDVHAEPSDAEEINARGTAAVLEAARRAGVKRVVYASTIWVYSDTEDETVSETTLLPPPAHLYTATKLAGELYCRSYQELYGVNYTILRFGIPYGPRAREAAVVPAFVNKAFAGEPLTLAGDGMQSRRFVYVEDLAEGVVAGLGQIAENRVYNLSSDEDVTIKQIAEVVQEIVGNTEIVYGPPRPGDLGSKIVLSDRAHEELGWTAATPFPEGVRRYVEWRREQAAQKSGGHPDPLAVAGEPEEAEACPRKVLIISADIGEGHDLPARAVAREIREQDPEALISIVNGLPAMGPLMTKILRENSAFMFRWVPWLFDFQYRLFMDFTPTRWLTSRLLFAFGHRGLMRLIKSHSPDLIVSTYPGTTQLLGDLRRSGRLDVPCYSSITDLAGLRFWAHPGIDLHFITHPESQEEVERIAGPGSVRWAKPPTNPAFLRPRDRVQARATLGLPAEGTVVTVSGGGWGVGDVIGAVRVALEVPDAEVLCLCGHNEGLQARVNQHYAGDPRLRVMGFTNRMGDVMAASDALIHSSAGLTVLEAIIRGCPVISYGFGFGHVRVSNQALERFKLAQVAHNPAELKPALEHALTLAPEPDASFAARPSTAALILANTRRALPLPTWRVRAVRTATALGTTALIAIGAFTSSLAYRVAEAFGATAVTAVTTPKHQVGIFVDASAVQVPMLAQSLTGDHLKVTFAISSSSAAAVLDARITAHYYGDETMPRIPDGGLVGWVHTSQELHWLAHKTGWRRHFLYASNGPSLAQWILGHDAGGKLISGKVRISHVNQVPGKLNAGELVEIRPGTKDALLAQLHALSEQLHAQGLSGVGVRMLMSGSGNSD
jgi:UDP-glucose 4-epimerase